MKKIAFTLSEVILTMTIVGVVAAMTIPTLSYRKTQKEYEAKLKNFYSRMDNAILEFEADGGRLRDTVKPSDGFKWYIDNIDPYLGHQYTKNGSVYFKDGASLGFYTGGSCLDMIYDVNGDKAPNKVGRDKYVFLMCFNDATRAAWIGNKDIFFGVYGSETDSSTSRDDMINNCKSNANKCTRLLQNDGWEFKRDYPYKF